MDFHQTGDSSFIEPDEPQPLARRIARRAGAAVLFLLAIGLVGGIAAAAFLFAGGSDVEDGKRVKITIPANSDAEAISKILGDEGIVDNELVFRARLKLHGDGSQFKSGSYTMVTGSSYDTVVRVLDEGPAPLPTFDVSIPEGMRVEEVAAHIDSLRVQSGAEGGAVLPKFTGRDWLTAVKAQRVPAKYGPPKSVKSMEGFLFPATYELRNTATAEQLVQKQLAAFASNFDGIDMTRAKKANLTPYDVVIIASLIEREAQLDNERGKIAAVIWNRLKDGEPLGIDATFQYVEYKPGTKVFWKKELLQSELDRDTPWNLRLHAGLPPTPIANPGRASLEAAANPAKVDFKYYVADPKGSGKHFFTASYDEFLAHPYQQG